VRPIHGRQSLADPTSRHAATTLSPHEIVMVSGSPDRLKDRTDGGRRSLLVVMAQFGGAATVWVLAITRGVGGASRLDLGLAGIAVAGLIGWYTVGSPTLATLSVVVADAVAVPVMLPKAYTQPYSETLSAFVLSALSGLFAMAGGRSDGLQLAALPDLLRRRRPVCHCGDQPSQT
jgi:hypothetical protein